MELAKAQSNFEARQLSNEVVPQTSHNLHHKSLEMKFKSVVSKKDRASFLGLGCYGKFNQNGNVLCMTAQQILIHILIKVCQNQ